MRRVRDVAVGAAAGVLADLLVVIIGLFTCGGESGEIPPFFALVLSLWLFQWAYMVPAMIGMLVARRPWIALGVLASGLVIGALSVVGMFILGATTV